MIGYAYTSGSCLQNFQRHLTASFKEEASKLANKVDFRLDESPLRRCAFINATDRGRLVQLSAYHKQDVSQSPLTQCNEAIQVN